MSKKRRPTIKNELKMNSFKFILQEFLTAFTHLDKFFCQTVNCIVHYSILSVAVSVFCFVCESETPNLTVLEYLHLSTSHDNKCGNNLEETHETYHVIFYRYGDLTIIRLYCNMEI